MPRLHPDPVASDLTDRFAQVRRLSAALCEPLEPEDLVLQSMPDASPPKWHLAHTTWFFETFVLRPHVPGYRVFHPAFDHLFNSYYESVGSFHPRTRRGMLSRPTFAQVCAWREHVDAAVHTLLETAADVAEAPFGGLVELGLHHEQQHQELLLMDVKHHLGTQPLQPAYRADLPTPPAGPAPLERRVRFAGGVREVGHLGPGFAFDNESPRHRVFVEPFALAAAPVSNAQWLDFIADGGYRNPLLWLSDGWAAVQARGWEAPLYWHQAHGQWLHYTLGGVRPLNLHAPVAHVSFYEADAFARWAGAGLPTEAQWELAATDAPVAGNLLATGLLEPAPLDALEGLAGLFGDVWEWTASPYTAYPGFQPPAGALGEYNGKFMSGQMVLRGGCCVTPAEHIRPTYRNFYPPDARWPFAGLRLAWPA